MEKRNLNISFYRAGNGTSCRLTLPIKWLRELEITADDKAIELIYDKDNKQLIIKKR